MTTDDVAAVLDNVTHWVKTELEALDPIDPRSSEFDNPIDLSDSLCGAILERLDETTDGIEGTLCRFAVVCRRLNEAIDEHEAQRGGENCRRYRRVIRVCLESVPADDLDNVAARIDEVVRDCLRLDGYADEGEDDG